MTEPRRIAAISVTQYIQQQLIETPSFLQSLNESYKQIPLSSVGYKIRFEDTTDENTKIKIMTDGILLQELKKDTYLSQYSTIIIDEAHERNLNIDFILGLIKEVCTVRSSLKIIISSATINTALFSKFFFNCPIIKIEAPSYPIQTFFLPPSQKNNNKEKQKKKKHNKHIPRECMSSFEIDSDILINHIVTIVKQSIHKKEGDILIFLAGEKQIKNCIDELYKLPQSNTLSILPLYGRLDNRSQELVFKPVPKNNTKIIVATNIAETSITVDTIKVVIDSGRVKCNTYHHDKYITTLDEIAISKASALQRKGRSGRISPGICYQLYKKKEFETLEPFSKEEIHRTDLSEVILRMASQGIRNFEKFPFISPPQKQSIHASVSMLQELDALDEKQNITDIGTLMSEFSLIPIHARILVEGIQQYPHVLDAIIIITSFLSTAKPFLLPIGKEAQARRAHRLLSEQNNDFLTYINIFKLFIETPYNERELFCSQHYLDVQTMYEIYNVYTQISNQILDKGILIGTQHDKESIVCTVARGLIFNICILQTEHYYRNRRGEKIYIHPGSMLFEQKQLPALLVAGEIIQTSKKFAHSASECRLNWIQKLDPEIYQELQSILNTKKEKNKKNSFPQQKKSSRFVSVTQNNSILSQQKNDTISIAKKIYTLQYINNKKILLLTWTEVKHIAKYIGTDELYRFGRTRCLISLKNAMYLHPIKLLNIPALYLLEKRLFPVLSTIPIAYMPPKNILDSESPKDMKIQNALIDSCMSFYIKEYISPAHAKKYISNIFFCSLETGKNGSLYIDSNSHFLISLYSSMRSIELLIESQKNKKLIAKTEKIYSQLYATYRLLEKEDI